MSPPPKTQGVLILRTCDCYVKWQMQIKVADGIKVANQLILEQGGYAGLSGWAACNHKGP